MRQIDKKTTEVKKELQSLMKDVVNIYQNLYECIDECDDDCLKSVIKNDKDVNKKELDLNEMIVEYIATFSPLATDLREAISYLKIANDLERIADYTTNIAKIFRRSVNFSSYEIKKIKYGISLVLEFLEGVSTIIDNFSTTLAYELVENDKELDDLYKNFYSEQIMNFNKERDVEAIISTVSILKYLERAGDHIVNIVEQMIYAQRGKYVNL